MFAIGFDRFAAQPEFLCNPGGAETRTDEPEYMKLPISQSCDTVIASLRESTVGITARCVGKPFTSSYGSDCRDDWAAPACFVR